MLNSVEKRGLQNGFYTYRTPGGLLSTVDLPDWYAFEQTRSVSPATVRRPKPSGVTSLRASGTQRTWTVDTIIDEGYRDYYRDSAGYQYMPYFSSVRGDVPDSDFTIGVTYPYVDGKMRAKIKHQTGNLLQDLVEFRQTVDLFSSGARDLFRAFHSLRSGRAFSDFVRILQRPRSTNELAIANRWLQYQYGVRPTMNSLYDYTEALAVRVRDGMVLHQRCRGKQTVCGDFNSTYGRTSVTCDTETRLSASYVVRDSSLKELSQVGITNPLAVVWEVIPYSFLIDQFINIGEFVNSIDALMGVSDLVIIETRGSKRIRLMTYRNGQSASHVIESVSRLAPRYTLGMPRLSFRLPGSSLWSRLASGIALLRQLRR